MTVSAIGLAIATYSLAQLFVQQVNLQWLILAALTLLTGSFTVRIPGIPARLSVSDTFVFASVLLFGPEAGTITVLLDALIISLRLGHHAREPFRVIFNVSLAALSTWIAAEVFFVVAGIPPYSIQQTPLGQILFPLFLFTLAYFLINSWLVTFALALEQDTSPYPIWRDNFLWLSVNYFGGASVAGLLVAYTRAIDLTTLGIIVPLLLISYLTFKTSMGRIEDANKHLLEVNRHYLSTIETLAMAIDAKDQITHGHIRRVQRYAIGLARCVGVREKSQIRAIEAAALLHDMGKLAIPEFILNKPGKLTTNEFEVMKQHTNIGADILSSIEFPYPVVPIVRHHHENWDGSGYPDGLKGVTIPLGARVLSVVDCFDALTSDRPYRPRLSIADAINVLIERRGSMYDPLIVDRFIEVQDGLSRQAADDDSSKDAIDTIATRLKVPAEQPAQLSSTAKQPVPLGILSLLRSVSSSTSLRLEDLGVIVSRHVRELTGAVSVAIYCVTPNEQAIKCAFADGTLSVLKGGPEIPLGERLSGWVAAHRTPIWNSDAALDLGSTVAKDSGMVSGSSVPVLDGESLVGVLTIYSSAGREITMESRLLLQSVAPMFAKALSASLGRDQMASFDATDSAAREALYAVLDAFLSHSDRTSPDAVRVALVTRASSSSRQYWPDCAVELIKTANDFGHAIRISATDLLLISTSRDFGHLGIEFDGARTTDSKRVGYRVTEIQNSLELREVLGLTLTSSPQRVGNPLIH